MTPKMQDLMHSLGHYGPPPEPLWLPWHAWSLPREWAWTQPLVSLVRA